MIKNIIFDLGEVVLDLTSDRMNTAFEALGVTNFTQLFTIQAQTELFERLELGTITPEAFYDGFRVLTGQHQLADEQIRDAWNLILADEFDLRRLKRLTDLAKNYQLYLFSNTNAIHVACFEARCLAQSGRSLASYFRKLFYSSDLHLRKPTLESFQKVIALADVNPQETLFIDDNAANIAGAASAGLRTLHLVKPQTILDLDPTKY